MRVNIPSGASAGNCLTVFFYNNGVSHFVWTRYRVFFFLFLAVKGRSRSSVPRLPPIKAERMRTAKALVEKAVKVTIIVFYPSAHGSDSLYLS